MDTSLPTALIVGIENFGARQLAIELLNRGLNVIGVGDYVGGMNDFSNFENRIYLKDVEEAVAYVFDFEGDSESIAKAKTDGAKLMVVEINKKKNRLMSENLEARKIKIHGLYGQEMDKNNDSFTKFLVEAAKAAVKNKNLIMPKKGTEIRLLSTDSGAELMITMAMTPGLDGETVEIWGGEIRSEELATKLIAQAKMTRYKILENDEMLDEIDKKTVEENWRKLRWQPEENWDKELELTLQYFFTQADEESRKPKEDLSNKKYDLGIEPKEERERMAPEVYVEEEAQNPSVSRLLETAPLEEREPKAELKEDKFEIEKIVLKNSNNRPTFVEPKEDLRDKIYDLGIKQEEPKIKIKKEKKQFKLPDFNGLKWVGIVLGAVVVLFLGTNVVKGWMIYNGLKQSVSLVSKRQFEEAAKITEAQYKAANDWDNEISNWGMNRWVWGRRWQELLRLAKDAATVEEESIKIAKSGELINSAIFEEKEIDWVKNMDVLKLEMTNLAETMGKLEARMGGDWSWMPGRYKSQLASYRQKIGAQRTVVVKGLKLVSIMPEVLGTDGKRRDYLILFQNENELRPSGGFIGSYGVITFDGGKMANLEVSDIYEADGQLKGHVEPPEPIKKYLGEGGWFMRDANWQTDFREASKDILWFFEKETGRKVDGVIAMNLSLAKAILGVTGEIFVPDFKEKVNKDNLYEQAEFYAETKFFPGSKQKASFLGMLTKQLFEQMKAMDLAKKAELVEALMEKADEREVQVNLANAQAAMTMSDLGWDGATMGGKCNGKDCFSDYLQVNEANFGVNKANYFLYRNMEQSVEISPSFITRVLRITYENSAKNNNWPGGNYKAYVRIYLPETSNLAEVAVNDPKGGKTVYQNQDLTVATVRGKKEVGLLLEVPFSSKRVMEIRYTDTINLSGVKNFSYLQYIQKQSGYGDTGLAVLVSVPEGFQINQVEPAASVVGGKLLFNQKLNKDMRMGVEMGK